MEFIAPMVVAITLILTVGGVILFRPLVRRLGDLLEIISKQRRGELENPKLERVETLLENVSSRLALVEERVDFTDALLASRSSPGRLPDPQKESWRE